MYIRIYIYIYIYIYINIYIYVYMYVHACGVRVRVRVRVCVCACVWISEYQKISLYLRSYVRENLFDTTIQTDSELVVMRFFLNAIFLKVTEKPRVEFIIILRKANSIMVTLLGIFWLVFLGIFLLLLICFRFLVGIVAKFHF